MVVVIFCYQKNLFISSTALKSTKLMLVEDSVDIVYSYYTKFKNKNANDTINYLN